MDCQLGESLNLSIYQVPWKYNCSLSNASIGQIICCLNNVLYLEPKKVYEEKLYEFLKPSIQTVLIEFNNILNCHGIFELNVKYYNLIVPLPNNVSIFPEEHDRIKLGKPKIGALIKAIKQRIEFILIRDTPKMYLNNQFMLDEFLKMRTQLQEFLIVIRKFEQEFILAVDEAHKAQNKFKKL